MKAVVGTAITKFCFLRGGTKGSSRTAVMDFLRADFNPFRRLVDRVLWKAVLKGKGAQVG